MRDPDPRLLGRAEPAAHARHADRNADGCPGFGLPIWASIDRPGLKIGVRLGWVILALVALLAAAPGALARLGPSPATGSAVVAPSQLSTTARLGSGSSALSAQVARYPLGRLARPRAYVRGASWFRNHIIAGTAAAQGQLPFMALIIYSLSATASELCSGTVISSNVILTAGHCAVDVSTGVVHTPDQYTVITGAADWTNPSSRQTSTVAKVVPYPLYVPGTASSDAALLILSAPISAPPIALATSADQYLESAGTAATVAGWGETYAGSAPASVLQWAPTVVQGAGYCSQYPSNLSYSPDTNLCAVNSPSDNTGTCQGDSGGPLFATDGAGAPVEVGITSYGPVGCVTTIPDFFTAVLPLSTWIHEEVQAVAPPPLAPTPPPPPGPAPGQPASARLSFPDAQQDVRRTLAAVFARAFRRGHTYRADCLRVSSSRVRCNVSFWYGPNDYSGAVTIYYLPGTLNPPEWRDQYVLRWVNDACDDSSHWRHCRIHARRGSS